MTTTHPKPLVRIGATLHTAVSPLCLVFGRVRRALALVGAGKCFLDDGGGVLDDDGGRTLELSMGQSGKVI